jgi:Ricin-type beta-trefoil lectin domain
MRTLNDTAADADPFGSPIAYYDSYQTAGWLEGGGTGVAAAITAGVYALAGTPVAGTNPASYPYAHSGALNDITSGSTGTCSIGYLCTAGSGYDGPTGVGTPNFTTAFNSAGTLTGVIYSGVLSECLGEDGSPANGNAIVIWVCNGGSFEKWTAESDGTLQIFSKCMDVIGGGTANGTKIQLYSCDGTGAQQWRVLADGQLLNPESGRCLDDPRSHTANGTQLDIYDCLGSSNELWILP